MNLSIDSYSASFTYNRDGLLKLIDRLERLGYKPLVRRVAKSFANIFGGSTDNLQTLATSEDSEERLYTGELNRRRLLTLEKHGYDWNINGIRGLASVPEMNGELFFTDDGNGVLFVSIVDPAGIRLGDHQEDATNHQVTLRAGLIGDQRHHEQLHRFLSSVSDALREDGAQLKWHHDEIENDQFKEFMAAADNSTFTLANAMSEQEMKSARALENAGIRDVALDIRKAGIILAKDLLRQKPDLASDIVKFVDQLLQAELLRQEYVVICSKTGAHVNRVESRTTIEQLSKLGVLCSCGKHISEEPMEGLLSSEPLLQKMLDRNYWLTASIVRVLTSLGVPTEKIILNPSPTTDDVEILSDVDGSLLMFELKDSEFGFAQALQFASRIGMHHPQLAFIVSTRGIAPEVKDHFKRVKIDTQMVYITNLNQLESTLTKVVDGFRLKRVRSWFNAFQSMLNFGLSPLMVQRLYSGRAELQQEDGKEVESASDHTHKAQTAAAPLVQTPPAVPVPPAAPRMSQPQEPEPEPLNRAPHQPEPQDAAPAPIVVPPAPVEVAAEPAPQHQPVAQALQPAVESTPVPPPQQAEEVSRNAGHDSSSLREAFRMQEQANRVEAEREALRRAQAEEGFRMPQPAAEPVVEQEAFRMPAPPPQAAVEQKPEPVAEPEGFHMPAVQPAAEPEPEPLRMAAPPEPVVEREPLRMATPPEPVVEREPLRMATPPEPAVEREPLRMAAPPEPVVERRQPAPPEPVQEFRMPEAAAVPQATPYTQPAPALQQEVLPQPEPVAEPFMVPVPQNVEDALRVQPAAQPQAPGPAPAEESAWNSLSSILSSVAAIEGAQAPEAAQPAATLAPPVAPPPQPAARPAAAGLKLSLFSDDDDDEFARPAQAAAPAAQYPDGTQAPAQDAAHDEQDETAKRQSRLAAIRGLRGA